MTHLKHNCACRHYAPKCDCGVYTDEHGDWCANENCRTRLIRAKSPEVTGKYGEIVPDTRRWSVYGYNDGPDGDGSDIRFDNVERIEVLAAVAKCLAHGSSNVYLHAS